MWMHVVVVLERRWQLLHERSGIAPMHLCDVVALESNVSVFRPSRLDSVSVVTSTPFGMALRSLAAQALWPDLFSSRGGDRWTNLKFVQIVDLVAEGTGCTIVRIRVS